MKVNFNVLILIKLMLVEMIKYVMYFVNCFISRSILYENVYFVNYVIKYLDKCIVC